MSGQEIYDVIIPLSGGIDSCAAAYHWLRDNPNKKALLLHIQLVNGESKYRQLMEHKASHDIIAYFKQDGLNNFTFKQSQLDYVSAGQIPPIWDIEAVNFLVGTYMRGFKINSYIKATNKDDFDQINFEDRLKNSMTILRNVVYPDLEDIKVFYPNKSLSKKQVIDGLPKPLLNLCWYCRTPVSNTVNNHNTAYLPCCKCEACLQISPHIL